MSDFTSILLTYLLTLSASVVLHSRLLETVLRAPVLFFETVPVGRLLSRFSKDIDVLDQSIPEALVDSIACAFEVRHLISLFPSVVWDQVNYFYLLCQYFFSAFFQT